jgi:flagellar biogenesis protein FliO
MVKIFFIFLCFLILGSIYFIVNRSGLIKSNPFLKKRDKKYIDIISSHYFGPKKSIVITRVFGKLVALGITDQSIQVISEVDDDFDRTEKSNIASDSFSDHLISSTRNQIKNKLETLKSL